jgi:hypothetical protein
MKICGRNLSYWLYTNENDIGSMDAPLSKLEIQNIMNIIQTNIMSRRLMGTTSGRMGVAPWTAQQGDVICVLPGCSVPLVIRPEGNGARYRFIGECYVHRIVEGEILERVQTGEI